MFALRSGSQHCIARRTPDTELNQRQVNQNVQGTSISIYLKSTYLSSIDIIVNKITTQHTHTRAEAEKNASLQNQSESMENQREIGKIPREALKMIWGMSSIIPGSAILRNSLCRARLFSLHSSVPLLSAQMSIASLLEDWANVVLSSKTQLFHLVVSFVCIHVILVYRDDFAEV